MSLLDFLNTPEAQLGVGLLAYSGDMGRPMGFGERLAGGLGYAQQQKNARQEREMRAGLLGSQMAENASQTAMREAQLRQMQMDQDFNRAMIERWRSPGGQQQPMQQAAPQPPGTSLPSAPGAMPSPQMQPAPGMAPGTQPGGTFPLSLNDIGLMAVTGRKNADSLFNMYKYATEGVRREAGATYINPMTGEERYYPKLGEGQIMGAGGQVFAAPGYASSNALIKRKEAAAVEAARYPYTVGADNARQQTQAGLDLVEVQDANGDSHFVPRLSLVTGQGQGGGMQQGGQQPLAKRSPIATQSQIALNDNWIKNSFQPVLDAGKLSSDMSANIQALRNLDVNTGWGTEVKATAAGVLEGLGIAPASAKMYAANSQKFQSIAMDRLMTVLQAQKGPQTEGDADRGMKTFVALKNTPEANAFVMDFYQAKANMDARRAAFYQAALPHAQREGDLTRVDREWRQLQGTIWADPILQKWGR